jgi:N-acylneuraminate cytidylyltransferase
MNSDTLVVIPARGGSKGIPGKNIKPLNNKPLIQYTIEVARSIFDDNQIIVSTDEVKIASVVEELGLKVPFIRPDSLATDTAGTYEVLLHALKYVEDEGYHPNTLVLLQPTSPFRKQQHVREALALYTPDVDMVVSVKETKSNPYYVLYEEDRSGFLRKSKSGNFTRRQDCPLVWEFNGAIYVINIKSLKRSPINKFERVVKFQMDEISSLDIDNQLDWMLAELCLRK